MSTVSAINISSPRIGLSDRQTIYASAVSAGSHVNSTELQKVDVPASVAATSVGATGVTSVQPEVSALKSLSTPQLDSPVTQ